MTSTGSGLDHVLHPAAERGGEGADGARFGAVDVLAALFVHLEGPEADPGSCRERPLRETRRRAEPRKARFRQCAGETFFHPVGERVGTGLVEDRLEREDVGA